MHPEIIWFTHLQMHKSSINGFWTRGETKWPIITIQALSKSIWEMCLQTDRFVTAKWLQINANVVLRPVFTIVALFCFSTKPCGSICLFSCKMHHYVQQLILSVFSHARQRMYCQLISTLSFKTVSCCCCCRNKGWCGWVRVNQKQ